MCPTPRENYPDWWKGKSSLKSWGPSNGIRPTPVISANGPAGWRFPKRKLNAREWSGCAIQIKPKKNLYLQLRLSAIYKIFFRFKKNLRDGSRNTLLGAVERLAGSTPHPPALRPPGSLPPARPRRPAARRTTRSGRRRNGRRGLRRRLACPLGQDRGRGLGRQSRWAQGLALPPAFRPHTWRRVTRWCVV